MIIKNARVLNSEFEFEYKDLYIENGIFDDNAEGETIDCTGCSVIPGLVDIHIHGCGGFDSMDGRISEIGDFLLKSGTTSFLATTMTYDVETLRSLLEYSAPNCFGFHLEGPYISKKFKGAQNEAYIKNPDIKDFEGFDSVKLLTLAPELEGSMDYIKSAPFAIALGHTECDYVTAKKAFNAGAVSLTHTFNAMPPIHHRNPGPIGAAFDSGAYAQVICDGIHIHESVIRMLYAMFGSDKMVLISDSMRATGLADGEYEFGGQTMTVTDSVARTESGALAGSTSTLWQCVKKCTEFGIPFEMAVKMATKTPAAMVGLNEVGEIKSGKFANFLVLDSNNEIKHIYFKGQKVN